MTHTLRFMRAVILASSIGSLSAFASQSARQHHPARLPQHHNPTVISAPWLTVSSRKSLKSGSPMSLSAVEFVDPSYNLAIGAFGVGLLGGFLEDIRGSDGEKKFTAKFFGGIALVFTLFSAFLVFQTTTLRFTFDDTSFSLVKSDGSSIGDNIKVGGENKWSYSSFANWDFLPSQDFPILVYFKETQTPLVNREDVPIVIDSLDGQVHFFPAISNTKQLENGFRIHNCANVE